MRAKLVGVSGMVVPRAMVPLECRVSDDYAVTAAEVSYVWRDEMAQMPHEGKIELPAAKDGLGQRELGFADVLDLTALQLPTGTSLNFHVAARDNERRDSLAPQDPYEEVVTVLLRIRGGDLKEYRSGRIDKVEARKRVRIGEF